MANSISGTEPFGDGRRPNKRLYFDTTTNATITGKLMIIGIFWTSNGGGNLDIAADDDFLLSDSDGDPIIGKRAEADGDDLGVQFPSDDPLVTNGITVTTMDGGVCYIWLARG